MTSHRGSTSKSHLKLKIGARSVLKLSFVVLCVFCACESSHAAGERANPCALSTQELAAFAVGPSADIHDLNHYQDAAFQMLQQRKFRKLDCIAGRLRAGKERFPGGIWKLHTLYVGLDSPVRSPQRATPQDWQRLFQRLEEWTTVRPASVTARVALASAYVGYGWDARGGGYSDTVSDSGWQLFRQRTTKARKILEGAKTLPAKCPEWYVAMLGVAQNQGWSQEETRALFETAFRFEPPYYYYARIVAGYLKPQWSGQQGLSEKFLDEIADRIGGDEGHILYFQVASNLFCGCGDKLQLSWARIEKGFEAADKKYGASLLNLNLFAFMAVHFPQPDPIAAQKAFTRIGDQWDAEKWRTREDFESAKKWAEGAAPALQRRRDMETAAEENSKTPEGHTYRVAFENSYRELMQQCAQKGGGNLDRFETLTKVGARGSIQDMRIYWNGLTAICMYQKLHDLQQQNAAPFPAPPHDSFWVRVDFDGADFAPANLAASFDDAASRGDSQEHDASTKDYFSRTLLPYYGRKYGPVLQSCFGKIADPASSSFGFVAAIGSDGRVQRIYSNRETNIYQCMRGELQQEVFPVPPVAPYYLHIEMNFTGQSTHSSELEQH